MTDAPLPNSPEARTPDGTLKDQGASTTPPSDSSTTPAKTPETDGQAQAIAKQPTDASAINDKGITPAGAPETYADFVAPEGYEFDKAALDAAIPIFKE